jgi:hypothetical protein
LFYICTKEVEMNVPVARKEYRPSAAWQNNKLSNKDSDWNLRGSNNNGSVALSRTRGGGQGRPNYSARKKMFINELSSDSSDSEVDEEDDEAEIDGIDVLGTAGAQDDEEEADEGKPDCTRAIVDLAGLLETLNLHCRCPECNGPLTTDRSEDAVHCYQTQVDL